MFIARRKRGLGGDWMKFRKVSVSRRRRFFLGRGLGGAIIALAAAVATTGAAAASAKTPVGADVIQSQRQGAIQRPHTLTPHARRQERCQQQGRREGSKIDGVFSHPCEPGISMAMSPVSSFVR
ncbi:MAG: hypothetical protein K1X71_04910 [Pirellulales bacterium]|nr:hypothetical protein [Pirellulales bacterium]